MLFLTDLRKQKHGGAVSSGGFLTVTGLLCTSSFSLSAQALSVLGRRPSSDAEQCQINASKLLVLLNLSLTHLKLERPAQALAYGEKALKIDQRNAKALFRCGQVGKSKFLWHHRIRWADCGESLE